MIKTMISVSEALNILENEVVRTNDFSLCALQDSLGAVLAEDIYVNEDLPNFDQSAMDGYAIRGESRMKFSIIGEVPAGSLENFFLEEGEAVRIFTGGMVPESASAVVQQEWTKRQGKELEVNQNIPVGKNIRRKGEQFRKGEKALEKGTVITAGVIGFIASLGLESIPVFKLPKIELLMTGNELVAPGNELKKGQVYESNSSMLMSALKEGGFEANTNRLVEDSFETTKNRLAECLECSDVIIITGGISVGDYDFVGKALLDLEVKPLFYKVKQKPGKPLFVGKKDEKLVFALPGNPAAALTCFYIYVLPSLRRWQGKGFLGLKTALMPLLERYELKGVDRAIFLKAIVSESGCQVAKMQSSAMLGSFARANGLIYVPEGSHTLEKGELVKIYHLP